MSYCEISLIFWITPFSFIKHETLPSFFASMNCAPSTFAESCYNSTALFDFGRSVYFRSFFVKQLSTMMFSVSLWDISLPSDTSCKWFLSTLILTLREWSRARSYVVRTLLCQLFDLQAPQKRQRQSWNVLYLCSQSTFHILFDKVDTRAAVFTHFVRAHLRKVAGTERTGTSKFSFPSIRKLGSCRNSKILV